MQTQMPPPQALVDFQTALQRCAAAYQRLAEEMAVVVALQTLESRQVQLQEAQPQRSREMQDCLIESLSRETE